MERTQRERDRREREKSENRIQERESALINGYTGQVGNNKIIKKIDYLIKGGDRIDDLMWVFCKNDGVKQKKQVFSVKQTESFRQADVNALSVQPVK